MSCRPLGIAINDQDKAYLFCVFVHIFHRVPHPVLGPIASTAMDDCELVHISRKRLIAVDDLIAGMRCGRNHFVPAGNRGATAISVIPLFCRAVTSGAREQDCENGLGHHGPQREIQRAETVAGGMRQAGN